MSRRPATSAGGGDLRLYLRLLREARPCWPHIGGVLVLGLAATPLALLVPVPLKIAVDSALGSHPLPGLLDPLVPGFAKSSRPAVLVLAATMVVAIELVSQLRRVGSTLLETYTGERLQLAFRARLFRHAQRLSLVYHDVRGTSDALYRIQYDAPAIQWIAVYGVTPFVCAGFTLAAMIAIIARIDAELALVALTVAPLTLALTHVYRKRLRASWSETKQLESSALSVVQEVLGALRVVKAFGQEEREQDRFVSRLDAGMRARIRVAMLAGGFRLLLGTATAVGTALVLYVGVRHVESGRLTLGTLLLVMGYLAQLLGPLQAISGSVATLQSSLASAERAFFVLDQEPDVDERPHARPLARAAGAVAFKDVAFAYDGKQRVLEGINFAVEPGSRVGIAGATGAGKTTLVNLLTRFYDPLQGSIMLDGVDIREYRVADLRNQFAIVLQEPVLFSATIAENIAYARPVANRAEIEAAARAANAHDFIAALPEGYETLVGERGMRLSGGERQRISLARAFLKDAPILILDEPTSSVDVRTEHAIIAAMERLMSGRTSFMIAHRLGTLEVCNVRLELEDGHLAGWSEASSAATVPPPVALPSAR